MDRSFKDTYFNVPPKQSPKETKLLGILRKIELFRPDILDSYPKLSKINPDMQKFYESLITSLEPLHCASLLKPTLGILYDIIDISRYRHIKGCSSLAMKYNIAFEELDFMKEKFLFTIPQKACEPNKISTPGFVTSRIRRMLI